MLVRITTTSGKSLTVDLDSITTMIDGTYEIAVGGLTFRIPPSDWNDLKDLWESHRGPLVTNIHSELARGKRILNEVIGD